MQTEYRGSKYMALLEEFRNLGIGGILFRGRYELSKKLGLVEKKHVAQKLSREDVISALDLETPVLADVRRAYDSREIDRAASELIRHLKTRQSPEFFFNWRERELYQKHLREQFADQETQLVEQADKICEHEFEIFGLNCVKCGPDVDWHQGWPLIHWSKIDIRGQDRIGDVRLTWELNRHQFFFTLGRAYWFTGDEKYAEKSACLMREWIDANPPEIGVNWYSNLEIAVRLISWIWAYNYFLDSPFFDDDLHLNFLGMVLQSCRHITRDMAYSRRSMSNNHVIGDAAALVFAGIMFPEFEESKSWRDTYISVLYDELDRQVYDDGTDFEQAISYHRFVLYFYLLLMRIMRINGHDVPLEVSQKIEKMVEFIMYAMKPDGTMPQIGDSDNARVLRLSNDRPDVLEPTLSTGAVMFQRGDFRKIAGRLSEETFWLHGAESIRAFDSLSESLPPDQSRGFPDGGYYVMRTGWNVDDKYMLFKCGPHADHGHADALHIELYCHGKSHLRDCGTYTYNGAWEWRTYFRSTKAHNTAMVDGESQSIPHRAFRWLKAARPGGVSWLTSRGFNYVDAEHDGYNRYKNPVTHRRSVFFVKPEYWIVFDQLIGRGKHHVELLFHTPHGEHELENSTKIFRSRDFAIIPVAPDLLKPKMYHAVKEPIQGWFSPCYGVKEPSTALVYSYTGELPETFVTVLNPGRPVLNTQLFRESRNLTINVELEDFSDVFILNREPKSPIPQTNIDTDAELIYMRKSKASGKITRIGLVSGSYVRLDGQMLLKAKTPLESVIVEHAAGLL